MRNPLYRLAFLCGVVVGMAALADAPPKFQSLRDHATPVGNLASLIERYVGDCEGFFVSKDCAANAAAYREKVNGTRLYSIISEDEATMIASGPYDPGKQIYTVKITPAMKAGEFFLTHGEPRKLDERGTPVVDVLTDRRRTPVGWNALRIQKLFDDKQLRVQVVFTPQGLWELPGRDGKMVRGMKARIEAVLVTIGRTGETFALWVNG